MIEREVYLPIKCAYFPDVYTSGFHKLSSNLVGMWHAEFRYAFSEQSSEIYIVYKYERRLRDLDQENLNTN